MDFDAKKRKIKDVCNNIGASKNVCTVENCSNVASTENILHKIETLNVEQLKQQLIKRGCRKVSGKKRDLQDR